MNKKLITIVFMTLLTGCVYQTVNSDEIDLATWYCEDKGGVSVIAEYFNGDTFFQCKEAFPVEHNVAQLQEEYKKYLKETNND